MRTIAFVFAFIFAFTSNAQMTSSPAATQARGNSFNPDIGMNLLLLYQNSNRGNDPTLEKRNGATLQEAELQFSSDVDPYWRLIGNFALHQEYDGSGLTATPATGAKREVKFEAEEAYAESLNLSVVTLKVGKFLTAFGKHNAMHAHAFPFIDAPLTNTVLFGEHGFNDVGASVAALLPLPWYSEVTLQMTSGRAEGLNYFDGSSSNDGVGVLHLKNLWDISDDLTFEFGASGATGKNSNSASTNFYGVDSTFKWRPNGNKAQAFIWTTEAIRRDFDKAAAPQRDAGVASWLQYQFALRWWLQVRGEYLQSLQQDPAATDPLPEYQRRQSVLAGFVPSEFSAIRLQYDHVSDGKVDDEHKVMLQFNYSIGAHPAHNY